MRPLVARLFDEIDGLRAENERLKEEALCAGAVNRMLHVDNERLQALLLDACMVFDHYDLPEHALHYRRVLGEQGKE